MQIAYALPILPGKTERVKEQAKEYEQRLEDYETLNNNATITRHSVWVQSTPMGDFEITVFELTDPTKLRLDFQDNEYDAWWRAFVQDTHGFDPEIAGKDFKPPTQILSAAKEGAGPERSIAFVVPVVPGQADGIKKLASEVSGERKTEHLDLHRRLGLEGENWFLQESPQGDASIVYFEGQNLDETFEDFVKSTQPYDVWFKGRLLEVTGIDWSQPPPPPPDLVFDWRA